MQLANALRKHPRYAAKPNQLDKCRFRPLPGVFRGLSVFQVAAGLAGLASHLWLRPDVGWRFHVDLGPCWSSPLVRVRPRH